MPLLLVDSAFPKISRKPWGRARQASDASAAWSRERRGVMRARGIEVVGATPVHRSAVSRPGLTPATILTEQKTSSRHMPGSGRGLTIRQRNRVLEEWPKR